LKTKRIWVYIFSLIFGFWTLLPFYYLIESSFMYRVEISAMPVPLFPPVPTLSNYLKDLGFSAYNVFTHAIEGPAGYPIVRGLTNSAIAAGVVAILTIAVAAPAGYVFGRLQMPHKNVLLVALLSTRTLPPIAIIVPFYILGAAIGLLGNLPGLIVVYMSVTLPMMAWVLMGVFASLPRETELQARVDGCSRWQALFRVVFRMAASGMTAVGVLTFLLIYNDYIFSWIFVQGTPATTIQPVFASMWFMIGQPNLMAAGNAVGLIVPVIVVIFFQRYITRLNLVDPTTVGIE
jgi:multiple sugar transport system permease protein